MIDETARGVALGNSVVIGRLAWALVEREMLLPEAVHKLLRTAETDLLNAAHTNWEHGRMDMIEEHAAKAVDYIRRSWRSPKVRCLSLLNKRWVFRRALLRHLGTSDHHRQAVARARGGHTSYCIDRARPWRHAMPRNSQACGS